MPEFKSLDDMNKYFKKNPKELLKQMKGEVVEATCTDCKSKQKVKITSAGNGKCLKCGKEINGTDLDIVIELR